MILAGLVIGTLVVGPGAFLAVGSKFLIRARGKHVFNPTNLALAALLVLAASAFATFIALHPPRSRPFGTLLAVAATGRIMVAEKL